MSLAAAPTALIGYTGFVGSTLLRQRDFDCRFRSTDIGEAAGRRFSTVVCAGAPAQKWIANREPDADERNIRALMDVLGTLQCDRLVLISTVDVFAVPAGVDENSPVPSENLHPYGRHRLMLERFVADRFARPLVVRLAGLVGPGLRKNVIYDLHNGHNLAAVNPDAIFQFYPMVNLWADLEVALTAGLDLLHLTAEPTTVAEIAREGFGTALETRPAAPAPRYDMRSRHARLFGGVGGYQYSRREVIGAVRAYAQSEPKAS